MYFIESYRASSLRYGAFALYVATLYLLQLDGLRKVSDNLPVLISKAFVIGNPRLQ